MSAIALSRPYETKWTIVSGAMKGSVHVTKAPAFTIGRSAENEFVIVSDPKCSRKHASVEWTANGCQITSLNDANLVAINGKGVETGNLSDGDLVTLGDTEVQFNLPAARSESPHSSTQVALLESAAAPMRSYADPQTPARPKTKSRPQRKKNNSARLLIYFILGIVVLFLFTGNSKKKKDELTLRTEQQIKDDIDAANKLQEAAQNLPIKKLDESTTSRQAQENFVRGFRDYRKGQFERSLDSFQACLALDPAHVLCNRYIRLAQRRFSELVQYDIVLGRKYRDQNQFKACRSSFRNVMVMVKDSNSPIYKEAKANYDACNAMVEGRY